MSQSKITLPVTIPLKPSEKLDIGVCVSISYGHIDTAEFVEWIELNKIFGMEEFNVYFAFMSNQTKKLLQYYSNTPDVIYNDMPAVMPVTLKVNIDKPYVVLNNVPSLNHCLFTNMHRYKYIAVIDYDEVIIPMQPMSYIDLIQKLNKQYGFHHDNWACYSFKNYEIYHESTKDYTQPDFLPKLQHQLKAIKTKPTLLPKTIINPK